MSTLLEEREWEGKKRRRVTESIAQVGVSLQAIKLPDQFWATSTAADTYKLLFYKRTPLLSAVNGSYARDFTVHSVPEPSRLSVPLTGAPTKSSLGVTHTKHTQMSSSNESKVFLRIPLSICAASQVLLTGQRSCASPRVQYSRMSDCLRMSYHVACKADNTLTVDTCNTLPFNTQLTTPKTWKTASHTFSAAGPEAYSYCKPICCSVGRLLHGFLMGQTTVQGEPGTGVGDYPTSSILSLSSSLLLSVIGSMHLVRPPPATPGHAAPSSVFLTITGFQRVHD
ncbi:hypothetical protein J6590_039975 [Homalodisca vitripennis]|nr:hypothetical protein J6590_039975 [Homalodisca vitripennis]